jgi:hypothetical protein
LKESADESLRSGSAEGRPQRARRRLLRVAAVEWAHRADEKTGGTNVSRRGRARERLSAPTSDYTDAEGNVLTLRGSLTAGARREYAQTLAGERGGPAATREDAWQRALELLFERLTVRWTIAGAPIERQKELLARFRVASAAEREWIRDVLRQHCAEHFLDVRAP